MVPRRCYAICAHGRAHAETCLCAQPAAAGRALLRLKEAEYDATIAKQDKDREDYQIMVEVIKELDLMHLKEESQSQASGEGL